MTRDETQQKVREIEDQRTLLRKERLALIGQKNRLSERIEESFAKDAELQRQQIDLLIAQNLEKA